MSTVANTMDCTIDIIVPVYNEEEGIENFYQRIKKIPVDARLIFVDNASSDKTVEIIKTFKDVTLIRHEKNEGYGASINDGINHSNAEIIVIIDADCEYPPEEITNLLKKLQTSDVVYASRFYDKRNANMPLLKKWGNQAISAAFNVLFKQNVTDLYTGCKALKRSALKGISFQRKGFEHVLEMGVLLACKGISIAEVPVDFTARRTGRSHMRHIPEMLKYFYLLILFFLSKDNK